MSMYVYISSTYIVLLRLTWYELPYLKYYQALRVEGYLGLNGISLLPTSVWVFPFLASFGLDISCSVAYMNALKPGRYSSSSPKFFSPLTLSCILSGIGMHSLNHHGLRMYIFFNALLSSTLKRNCGGLDVMYSITYSIVTSTAFP